MLLPSGSGVSLIEKLVILKPVSLFKPESRYSAGIFVGGIRLLTLHCNHLAVVYSCGWKSHLMESSFALNS